ncbi:putative lipid II flippase FtsW [Spiribacter sp. C176]|uniref:Probable peptidoglycan glycosyltransferase FtsW n=1 Tax=Spiribacter salilacus TaxID=2664894 RepID=A0A6N7QQH2_9GAMM|nr:putative lipid II flippase FtsW [Spiribacter salilacus]MRH78671.1 putative lipid II flippase FtsW [Spiribacter salilacus]
MAEAMRYPRLEALLGRRTPFGADHDRLLILAIGLLLGIGIVMMGSASLAIGEEEANQATYFLVRQLLFLLPAGLALTAALLMPLDRLRQWAPVILLGSIFLLVLVLLPGVGREINGATRWLPVGIINLQVSEVARVGFIVYLAAHLVRQGEKGALSVGALVAPAVVITMAGVLLLAQPDFGALVVLAVTLGSMLFVAGVSLGVFLLLAIVVVALGSVLVVSAPYRLERLTAFRDPWADPFDTGFQLSQSLIAVGRGEWLGVGLGNSVQKLFYLPEAHTDFLFAVLAEEFGLLGMLVVIGLYAFLVVRICAIGSASFQAERPFGGLLAYGVAVSLGFQAFVNMGVNLGLLPTKGLTLPLMSYGGSSLVMTAAALGLVLRVDYERRVSQRAASTLSRRRSR